MSKLVTPEVKGTIDRFVKFYYENNYKCKRKAVEKCGFIDVTFFHDYWIDIMKALDRAKEKK
jgi:hypothetical protein